MVAALVVAAASLGATGRAEAQATDQTPGEDLTAAVVRFSAGVYALDESVGTTTTEIILVARTPPDTDPPLQDFRVRVSSQLHTASPDDDYRSFFTRITFRGRLGGNWVAVGDAYESEARVEVRIENDDIDEDDETFGLLLETVDDPGPTIEVAPADPAAASRCTSEGCESLVTIVDDDTRGVTVDQTGPLSVDEGGTADYTLVLGSEPTGEVTVTPGLAGIVDADLSVSPAVTFTSDNWRVPQAVTVEARTDDNPTDGSATVTHAVSGGDYEANGVTAASVSVVEEDLGADPVHDEDEPADPVHDEDEPADPVVVTLVHVPNGTVIRDDSTVGVGATVVDGTTFGEDEQVFYRLLFADPDGGPAPGGADVELSFDWHHDSPIVPISGEISRIVLSLYRIDVWDSAVQILDNDVGNPDSTLTIRITGCWRNGCVIGEPSEITVTIADDDGGPAAAPPDRPASPWTACPDRGHSAQDTALKVIWEAPDFVGGAPIEHYELRYGTREFAGDEVIRGQWQAWPHSVAATSVTVSGLDTDTAYGLQVRAVNANGPGQWSFEGYGRAGEPDHICDILDELNGE